MLSKTCHILRLCSVPKVLSSLEDVRSFTAWYSASKSSFFFKYRSYSVIFPIYLSVLRSSFSALQSGSIIVGKSHRSLVSAKTALTSSDLGDTCFDIRYYLGEKVIIIGHKRLHHHTLEQDLYVKVSSVLPQPAPSQGSTLSQVCFSYENSTTRT